MIDLLLETINVKLSDYLNIQRSTSIEFKCVVGDISTHEKNTEGGNEEDTIDKVIISAVSIEEESSLKNNYPLRQVGSVLIKEKSAIYINVYILFAAKYNIYDTALQAISKVISFFQTHRRLSFLVDNQMQEAVFNLHNIGFENLNNLWTVLGGRYLPSVMYKARVLMFQESPPLSESVIIEIEEKESIK